MEHVAAQLPGYASVRRASEVLRLAQRSVRDLIYAGRLPSLRVGRLHYIKAADLEVERRRRLGLPVRQRAARQPRRERVPRQPTPRAPRQQSLDTELRRQRAAERAALVTRWAQRHGVVEPHVPARVLAVTTPLSCDACGRTLRSGRLVELVAESGSTGGRLCLTCGRRALLDWADRRRLEAAAARRLSQSLGEPEAQPGEPDPNPAEPSSDSRAA
ncbi:MAG TPA: helix-turn-helix domain-containing protein [Chloroflexota bacterium]